MRNLPTNDLADLDLLTNTAAHYGGRCGTCQWLGTLAPEVLAKVMAWVKMKKENHPKAASYLQAADAFMPYGYTLGSSSLRNHVSRCGLSAREETK